MLEACRIHAVVRGDTSSMAVTVWLLWLVPHNATPPPSLLRLHHGRRLQDNEGMKQEMERVARDKERLLLEFADLAARARLDTITRLGEYLKAIRYRPSHTR